MYLCISHTAVLYDVYALLALGFYHEYHLHIDCTTYYNGSATGAFGRAVAFLSPELSVAVLGRARAEG